MSSRPTLAHSDIDIFSDAVLVDPYPVYKQLRNEGASVYLSSCDAWFVGRYVDVRAALADWEGFSSAKGIGFNPIINTAWEEALICQDPPVHTVRRKHIVEALSPRSLRNVADTIDARAADLAEKVLLQGTFDGVPDFAHDLPIGVVMNLIGWPEEVRPHLLRIAAGSWNAAGPENARMHSGLAQLHELLQIVTDVYDRNLAVPGGFAAALIAAGQDGQISRETAIGMLMGYIVAAFETTISAMAAGLWLFATHKDEWDKLRANSRLAAQAANEIVRWESPLQNFARTTTKEQTLSDGSTIPAGARVIVSYASANRDERQFADPDTFRIDRDERQNLGFGFGPHNCAGQGLARMELVSVFTALASRVAHITLAGEPTRALNNIARSFSYLPLHVTADQS